MELSRWDLRIRLSEDILEKLFLILRACVKDMAKKMEINRLSKMSTLGTLPMAFTYLRNVTCLVPGTLLDTEGSTMNKNHSGCTRPANTSQRAECCCECFCKWIVRLQCCACTLTWSLWGFTGEGKGWDGSGTGQREGRTRLSKEKLVISVPYILNFGHCEKLRCEHSEGKWKCGHELRKRLELNMLPGCPVGEGEVIEWKKKTMNRALENTSIKDLERKDA